MEEVDKMQRSKMNLTRWNDFKIRKVKILAAYIRALHKYRLKELFVKKFHAFRLIAYIYYKFDAIRAYKLRFRITSIRTCHFIHNSRMEMRKYGKLVRKQTGYIKYSMCLLQESMDYLFKSSFCLLQDRIV